jgi:hypothetical protein
MQEKTVPENLLSAFVMVTHPAKPAPDANVVNSVKAGAPAAFVKKNIKVTGLKCLQ